MRQGLKKKTTFCLVLMLVSGAIMITSTPVSAEKQDRLKEIEVQIKSLEGEQKDSSEKRQELQKELEILNQEKEQRLEELTLIDTELNQTIDEITAKKEEIEQTEVQAHQMAQELLEAEDRVKKRDQLLKTRIRSMYESNSMVSYIDVLLGSHSFGDFLQRLDFLGSIVNQDQQLLREYIEDQELIEQKKMEIEELLVTKEEQLDELEGLQNRLKRQERQKRVRVASVEEELGSVEELDQQLQENMVNLSNQKSDLIAEQEEVQAELQRIEEERRQEQERRAEEARKVEEARKTQEAKKAEEDKNQKQSSTQVAQNKSSSSQGSNQTPAQIGGQLAWPVPGYSMGGGPGSRFGTRAIHPVTGERGRMHNGLDFPAPEGTPIVSVESGVVTRVSYNPGGWGNYVIIDHGNGLRSLYAHIVNGGVLVRTGESVQRGQQIAKVGTTGGSTGNHLHLEVWKNGKPVDPEPYLR